MDQIEAKSSILKSKKKKEQQQQRPRQHNEALGFGYFKIYPVLGFKQSTIARTREGIWKT